jgi:RNA polymerase sigma-70 factor (ECF subfamily)
MASVSVTKRGKFEILEGHRGELIAQAMAIAGGREDAEDVVQETLIEACRQPEDLDEKTLIGRARAINRRNAVDRLRSKRCNSRKIEQKRRQLPEQEFTTGGFSQLELRDSVNKAIMELPGELRELVVLRYFQYQSYKQIAQRLKMPLGTVHGRLMDAFAALFARLSAQLSGTPSTLHDDCKTQRNSTIAQARIEGEQA